MVTAGLSVEWVCLESLPDLKQARMFNSGIVCAGGKNYCLSSTHSGPGTVCSTTCFTILSAFWSIDSLEV